jgi:hypothetical protein
VTLTNSINVYDRQKELDEMTELQSNNLNKPPVSTIESPHEGRESLPGGLKIVMHSLISDWATRLIKDYEAVGAYGPNSHLTKAQSDTWEKIQRLYRNMVDESFALLDALE